jgi:hypothetical protein
LKLLKTSLILCVGLILVIGMITPGTAITDGTLDNGGHPFVGLALSYDADGEPLWRCSGTLMSPTVFMMAGHCTELPTAHVEIWFVDDVDADPDYPKPGPNSFGGTPHTHPDYYNAPWFMHDLGVVVLDEPYLDTDGVFGLLPELDSLDVYKSGRGNNRLWFTAVGYGLQSSSPEPVPWHTQDDRVRMVSYPELLQINTPGFTGDFSMLLTNNPTTGGTCFGDSGGPNFIEDTLIVAGVTSFGMNGNCAGTGGVYRVDGADDLNWLELFGVTPP